MPTQQSIRTALGQEKCGLDHRCASWVTKVHVTRRKPQIMPLQEAWGMNMLEGPPMQATRDGTKADRDLGFAMAACRGEEHCVEQRM